MGDIKKIVILCILILIIIPVWIRAFKRPKVLPGADTGSAVNVLPVSGDSVSQKIDTDRRIEEAQKKKMALPWKRDPFIPREKFKKRGANIGRGLKLSGILWDETSPAVIINDEIVGIGDEIDGKKIIRIDRDRVVLEVEGEEYILKLEEE